MIIQHILTPERTRKGVPAASKKKILEFIAECVSNDVPSINSSELFEALITRERLGTTGLGHGIALPHCRFKSCPAPTGLFLRMEQPVDYDAVDRQSVDLVFALIVPDGDNQEHLKILQAIAEKLSSEELVASLREAETASDMFDILVQEQLAPIVS